MLRRQVFVGAWWRGALTLAKVCERQRRARLIEETGYRAKNFRVFMDVFPTPGFLEERMYILLAERLTAG